jgi:hypothetical protein
MNTDAIRFFGAVAIIVLILASAAGADAPSGRYTVTNGTVYDGKTKLTWQQTAPATTGNWADAKTYCAGVGASLGGTGWRIPTRSELLTIVDFSRTNPSIDPTAFSSTATTTPTTYFWSSSPYRSSSQADAGTSGMVWYVDFFDGASDGYPDVAGFRVRCVR